MGLGLSACGGGGGPSGPPDPTPDAVGAVRVQGLASGDGVVTLPFSAGGQEYTLVVEATTPNVVGQTVRVSGNGGAMIQQLTTATARDRTVAGESYIRRLERDLLAGVPRGAVGFPRGLVLADDNEEEFFVVNKFSGASLTNPNDFDEILATRVFLGNNVQIYLDNRALDSITPAQILAVGTRFETQTYGIDVGAFGEPSDIDQNGTVVVLLSPTVNALTTPDIAAQGARITGFFFGIDLIPNPVFNPHANGREIFYAVVVNENQQFPGARVTGSEVVDLLGSVFAHEFEHMISFNQHVLLRNGAQEDVWLDEGLAHVAETLNGYTNQNRLRSAFFLENPAEVGLVSNDDDLDARGAWWLFVQYLAERFGTPVLGRLVQTRSISTANVAAATSQSFTSLFHDWSSMLLLDGEQVPGNDSLFELPSLDLRGDFELAKSQLGGRITGSFLGKRAVTPGGSAAAVFQESTSAFYVTVTASDAGNELVTIDGTALAGLQVSIIRTR